MHRKKTETNKHLNSFLFIQCFIPGVVCIRYSRWMKLKRERNG